MNLLQQLISTFTLLIHTDKTRNLHKHTAFPKLFHSEETTGQASMHWHQEERSGKHGIQTLYRCKQCDLLLCSVGCILQHHREKDTGNQQRKWAEKFIFSILQFCVFGHTDIQLTSSSAFAAGSVVDKGSSSSCIPVTSST
jgi:hypothetical protein